MKIILIPFSAGSLNKNIGTEKAPSAILKKVEKFFSNEENVISSYDVEEVLANNGNIRETFQEVAAAVKPLETGILLGGDHSLTYPAFKASGCDGLIILDAHADAMEGTDLVTHEEFVRRLVEDEFIDPAHILIVGLRHWHLSEIAFLKKHNISFFSMKHVLDVGVENVCDAMMEFGRKANKLYVSIDIDVVDPAFAPGTGYLEPGGISARELIYLVQRMKLLKNLSFVDIMEVNPDKDLRELTVLLAAKVVNEIAGFENKETVT